MFKGIAPPSQFPATVARIGGAHKWAEMLHHPCILGDPQRKGDEIRIGGAHKWAEMLHHPSILGDPQQRGQNQSKKKQKKQKQKFSHGVPNPAYIPADWPRWGLSPGPSNCRGTALPTRVGMAHL